MREQMFLILYTENGTLLNPDILHKLFVSDCNETFHRKDLYVHKYQMVESILIFKSASSANMAQILTENTECCVPLLLGNMIYQKELAGRFKFNLQNSTLKRI